MSNWSDLQSILSSIPGVKKAYFQPPEGTALVYPCIVFERSRIMTKFADNNPYNLSKLYTITVMDKNPDSSISAAVASLSGVSFDRAFKVSNLNHDVFTINF